MDLNWLREALADKAISQREIAARIGLSESQFSKVLSGDRALKASEADAIRRALGYILPEDVKPGSYQHKIMERMAELDERQKAALAVYLDALTGHSDPQ